MVKNLDFKGFIDENTPHLLLGEVKELIFGINPEKNSICLL
jgi:hypothetical protein